MSAADLRAALKLAVRQNSHDMLLTGEELRQCQAALLNDWADRPAAQPVAGWVMVPECPTSDMVSAFRHKYVLGQSVENCYAAMIAAAPELPKVVPSAVVDYTYASRFYAVAEELATVKEKFASLYAASNALAAKIGVDGEIDRRAPEVDALMDALHDLDGGAQAAMNAADLAYAKENGIERAFGVRAAAPQPPQQAQPGVSEANHVPDAGKMVEEARDAARYRWLRDVGDATWRPFGLRHGHSAAQADAAIDAALAAQARSKTP